MSIWKRFTQLFKEEQTTNPDKASPEAYNVDPYSDTQPKSRIYLEEMRGWVGACVSAISDELGSIKIKLYRYQNNEVVEVIEHPVLDLLYKVNEFTTKFDLFYITQSYLELCGESPWYIEKSNGVPINIYFLRPDKFSIVVNDNKEISGYTYDVGRGKKIPLALEDVIFLKIPNPAKPVRGLGTLEMARVSVDVDNYSEEWNKEFYKNSAHPDSVLKVNTVQMNEEQRELLKRSLRKNYTSLKNAHKTMVLFGDMEFEKMSSTQKDMDFLEQQKFSRDKILGIFRVPKAILAQTDGVQFAAAKAAQYIFERWTIKPKMTRLVAQLNEFLLPMFSGTENMFFDFVSPVSDDEELKIKTYESALKSGWMTINEVREQEGLQSVDGGDVIYQPMGMVELGTTQNINEDVKKFDGQIKAMKARNKSFFKTQNKFKDVKKKMINDVKSSIKKKLEEGETTTRILTDEEKIKEFEKKDALTNKYVTKVEKEQIKIFQNQRKTVMASVNKLKKLKQNSEEDYIYGEIKLDEKEETDKTVNILLPILTLLFIESGNVTFDLLDSDMTMELDTDTKKKLKLDSVNSAKATTKTTNESIKRIVKESTEAGVTKLQLQKKLGKYFSDTEQYRATRIADTETQRYNNNASLKAFEDSGLVKAKEWFVNPGACQFCLPMNGKIVSLKTTFFNKGDVAKGSDGGELKLDYTTTIAPPLHPNCRCILLPVFKSIKKIVTPKKEVKKKIVVVEVDKTKKEYQQKLKELEDKKVKIDNIEKSTKKNNKEIEEEKNRLKELRKSIIDELNNEQDVK